MQRWGFSCNCVLKQNVIIVVFKLKYLHCSSKDWPWRSALLLAGGCWDWAWFVEQPWWPASLQNTNHPNLHVFSLWWTLRFLPHAWLSAEDAGEGEVSILTSLFFHCSVWASAVSVHFGVSLVAPRRAEPVCPGE